MQPERHFNYSAESGVDVMKLKLSDFTGGKTA
jgi:hypothetical protein